MKISVLASEFSSNCLGRAYILARVLQRHWPVEIIGPMLRDTMWYPLAGDNSIEYKYIKIQNFSISSRQLIQLSKKISGDVIYASKPLMSSYGVGLLNKFMEKKPLILDIDDWEVGLSKESYVRLTKVKKIMNFLTFLRSKFSYWNIVFMEKLIPLADEITVSNSFLQNKFGGTIIPHGRDTNLLNPERFDRAALRKKFRIKKKSVVAYIGTPRTYKGIEDLVEAVSRIRTNDILLLLVGVTNQSENIYSLAKEKLGTERVICFAEQPIARIGEFLAISDVVVVPQRDSLATKGQIPAKIFDAMSMAKPVVSTKVNDIPEILKGCGTVVEPENIESLGDKVTLLLNNIDLALSLGRKARQECVEKYSWDAMEKILVRVFKKYE